MPDKTFRGILLLVGYGTFVAYVVQILINNKLRLAAAKEMGASAELLQETSNIYLFSALAESPLHITIGLFCLAAAYFMKHRPNSFQLSE